MKSLKLLLIPVLLFLLSSCEGVIYHKYKVKNDTSKPITVTISYTNNPDSITNLSILPDSSEFFYQTDEMQGFFSAKVPPKYILDDVRIIKVTKDTLVCPKNYNIDSLWTKKYIPGTYIYSITIEDTDF